MDLVDISFEAYEEYGGLRMVACRETEEGMEESDEQFQVEDEGDEDWRAGAEQGKLWIPRMFWQQERRS